MAILDDVVKKGGELYDRQTRHDIRMAKIARRMAKRKIPIGYVERDGNLYEPWELPAVQKPSNQRYIYRYHATDARSVPSIIKQGLLQQFSREGERAGKAYDPVFTSVSRLPWYKGGDAAMFALSPHDALIELQIPKEDYAKMPRLEWNPHYNYPGERVDVHDIKAERGGDNSKFKYGVYDADFNFWNPGMIHKQSVQHHGRADLIDQNIDPRYIRKICIGNGAEECYTPEEWLERFGE